MKPIKVHVEEHRGRVFELSLNLDDAAMAEGSLRMNAQVATWPEDEPGKRDLVTAEVEVRPDDDGRPIVTVKLAGSLSGTEHERVIFERPLADLIDAEQVLDAIPAWAFGGDLIVGCLVRSGLSALVGQLLDCKKDTAELPWYWDRMRALCRCLLRHVPDMSRTAALRAGKCIWRFGF